MRPKRFFTVVSVVCLLLLGTYFLVRLVDQSQIMTEFPLDTINDYSSRMATLHFLKECGFLQKCPYWYNGFTLFEGYPPGTFFLMYPLFLLTANVQVTIFLFVLFLFVLDFYFLYLLLKHKEKGLLKSALFFMFLFGNAISIGNFIRLGRITEHVGWTIFLCMIYLIYKYKDKKFDVLFYVAFTVAYGLSLISHQAIAIVAQFPILSLFLIKPWKEKIKLVGTAIGGVILASFWLIPYFSSVSERSTLMFIFSSSLLDFKGDLFSNLISIAVCLFFFMLLYMHLKKKDKKEALFYAPIAFLVILYLTRIVVFLPLFKNIVPGAYLVFTLFFALYLLCTMELKGKIAYLIYSILVIASLGSIAASHLHTPYFVSHTALEENMLALLEEVDGPYMMFFSRETPTTSYGNAYYAYAAIYLNKTTPSGWSRQIVSAKYLEDLSEFQHSIENRDCEAFKNYAKEFNATNFIGHRDICDNYEYCSLKLIEKRDEVCLYKLA